MCLNVVSKKYQIEVTQKCLYFKSVTKIALGPTQDGGRQNSADAVS